MSDDITQQADVEAPEREPVTTDPHRTVPAGAFVAAVMVAAVLGILAVIALTSSSGSGDDDDLRAARLAAGRFGERFLTFDHDGLDDWKAQVLALSTGGFAGEVEDAEAGLRRLIGESELDAKTQVTDIFIGEIDRGAVEAVLVYDRDLTGTTPRSETDRYLQLSMVKVDGIWLVDNVIDIASAGGTRSSGSAPAPGRTSPGSAPSTTAAGGG